MIGNLGMPDGSDALVPLGGKLGAKPQAKGDAGPDSGRGWQSVLDKADGPAHDATSDVTSDKDMGEEVVAVGAVAQQMPQPISDISQKTAALFQEAMARNTPALPDGAEASGAKKAVADFQVSAIDPAIDTVPVVDAAVEQSAAGDGGVDAPEPVNVAKNLKAAVAQAEVTKAAVTQAVAGQARVADQSLAADDPVAADMATKADAAAAPTAAPAPQFSAAQSSFADMVAKSGAEPIPSDPLADEMAADSNAGPSLLGDPQKTENAQSALRVDVPRAELARAAGQQMAYAISQHKDGQIELTLSPEELGRVRMTLVPSVEGMMVNIQADRDETLEMLRRNIESLASEFRDMGYSDVSFAFGQQMGQGHTGAQADHYSETMGQAEGAGISGRSLAQNLGAQNLAGQGLLVQAGARLTAAGLDLRV